MPGNGWISYTENVGDDAWVHGADVIEKFLDSLSIDDIQALMIEFGDKSFVRYEKIGSD